MLVVWKAVQVPLHSFHSGANKDTVGEWQMQRTSQYALLLSFAFYGNGLQPPAAHSEGLPDVPAFATSIKFFEAQGCGKPDGSIESQPQARCAAALHEMSSTGH